MKLSDLDSDQIQLVAPPSADSVALKLSDLHLDDISVPEANPNTSATAAASTGFFSGLPFAKQIGAAGKTGLDILTGITPLSQAGDEYKNTRDSLSQDFSAAQKAHPVISGAASLASAGMGAPALEGVGGVAAQGATYGALDAASNAEADDESASGIALSALKGGAIGGVIGKGVGVIGEKLEPYISKVGKSGSAAADTALDAVDDQAESAVDSGSSTLMKWAKQNALKSLNPTAGDIESLGVQGQQDMGQYLLNNGLASKASMEQKLTKVNSLLDDTGSKIGKTVKQLDSEGAQSFNPSELSDHIQNTYADNYKDSPAYNWVLNQVKKVTPEDGGNLSFQDSFDLKKLINTKAYSMRGDPAQMGNLQFLRNVGNDISNQYKQAAAEFLSPAENASFLKNNNDYSLGLKAQDILEGSQAKELKGSNSLTHNFDKATDLALAAGSLAHPGVLGALALKKGAQYVSTPGFKAPVQQSLANAGDAIASVLQKTPTYFGKYAAPLQAAASRGSTSLAVTHNILQQSDPDYREKVRKLQDQGNE